MGEIFCCFEAAKYWVTRECHPKPHRGTQDDTHRGLGARLARRLNDTDTKGHIHGGTPYTSSHRSCVRLTDALSAAAVQTAALL